MVLMTEFEIVAHGVLADDTEIDEEDPTRISALVNDDLPVLPGLKWTRTERTKTVV